MKKLMMSIFIVTALASCSSENELIDNGGIKGDERVEIKLKGGVSAVTKAAIPTTPTEALKVFFLRKDAAENTTISWDNTSTLIPATIETTLDIKFRKTGDWATEEKQYYDPNPDTYTYLSGVYLADETTPSVNADGTIAVTINGTQDILASTIASANKNATDFKITFNHMLSQLTFKITKDNSSLNELTALYGNIESIAVTNQPSNLTLTLGSTPTITTATTSNPQSFTLIETATLGANPVELKGSLMVYSDQTIGSKSKPIILEIKCQNMQQPIQVPVTLTTEGLNSGATHDITLTFSKTAVTPTAVISAWEPSNNPGTGTI